MNQVLRRVAAAFGAHSFGQAVNIGMQVASLPLFLSKWDLSTYGTWLLISAMPTYLSMADGGLVTASANKISIASASGDKKSAVQIFQSAQAFLTLTSGLCLSVLTTIVFAVGLPGISDLDRKLAVIFLAAGVLLAQFNGLAESIFRACDRHARGVMLGNNSRLLEFFGAIIGLFSTGTFAGVALFSLVMRTLGLLITAFLARRLRSGITWGFEHASTGEVRTMMRPALSFMAFPLTNALSIQGVTLLIGHLFGPASVSIFSAYRTISRVAIQVTGLLGNSLWAEFTRLYARGERSSLKKVYQRGFRLGLGAAALVSMMLFIAAPTLLSWWSGDKIPYQFPMMAAMILYAAIGGTWSVPRTLMMAINQHSHISIQSILGAMATLFTSFLTGTQFGLNGVAMTLAAVEAVLALSCIYLANRLISGLKP